MNGLILIVDDEAPNRTLVRRVLEPVGYSIIEAADGRQAIEAVTRHLPDLVLMDLEMPGMDGYSALRTLKSDDRTRLIPVVMLTSHDQIIERVTALEIGVDDYMAKPFNPMELKARVASLVSLKRFTDDLEHASQVLHSVAHIVDRRDAYTGEHCTRVGHLATELGKALRLDEKNLKTLRMAGIFHDLGKVAVPDSILRKPGKLTPEEFGIMKTHAAIGADLIQPMRTMAEVVPLIRHHHEKLDGSGYPDRLGGKDISLIVRIVSVADIYDALATQRPYKEALPHETCMRIMREEAGKGWWDRDVVELLANVTAAEPQAGTTSPSSSDRKS